MKPFTLAFVLTVIFFFLGATFRAVNQVNQNSNLITLFEILSFFLAFTCFCISILIISTDRNHWGFNMDHPTNEVNIMVTKMLEYDRQIATKRLICLSNPSPSNVAEIKAMRKDRTNFLLKNHKAITLAYRQAINNY